MLLRGICYFKSRALIFFVLGQGGLSQEFHDPHLCLIIPDSNAGFKYSLQYLAACYN